MEILLGIAGLAGLALLLQSKSAPVPSDADYAAALNKLRTAPDDPAANTVAGKYLSFGQGNFKEGVPYLLKSGDAMLKTLAEHEFDSAYTDTAVKQVGMGDEWVAAAKNFKPLYRTFYDRASQWYALAYPDLDGIWRDKLKERFTKLLQSPVPGGAVKKGLPTGWMTTHPASKVFLDTTVAHNGARSARIELARDGGLPFWFQSPSLPVPAARGEVICTAYIATELTNSGDDKLMLNFYNAAGGIVQSSETKFLPDSPYWRRVEVKATVPKNAVKYAIAVFFNSTVGTVWVDDVSLKSEGKELIDNGSFER